MLNLEKQSPPRWLRLRAWMLEHSVTCAVLGKALGCSSPYAYRLISEDFIPRKRHVQLVQIGVPCELLPQPKDPKRGPKGNAAIPEWMQNNIKKMAAAHASA